MLLDDFNPSLLKMAGVWYGFALACWAGVWLRARGVPSLVGAAPIVAALTLVGALISHMSRQNEILMWVTIVFAIITLLLLFILTCADTPSDYDFKMYAQFLALCPLFIGFFWVLIAALLSVGHYVYDWLAI